MGDKIFVASKVSEIVTERILEQLENGVVPWHKSWRVDSRPVNWENRRPYNGVNLLLLEPGEYLTFKQISKLGARLKKGAKGHIVVFWKVDKVDTVKQETRDIPENEETVEVVEEEQQENTKTVYLLRYYYVFNVNDVEGLPARKKGKKEITPVPYDERVRKALKIVTDWNTICPIKHGNYEPCYSPANDTIYMPPFSSFTGNSRVEEYFSTVFHEIVHSTGHKTRLDRHRHSRFGDWHYAQEELVAEIGSAFLLSMYGLDMPETFKNNVAYISYWLEQLRNDKTLIIKASGKAERAVEYILERVGEKQDKQQASA